VRTTIQKPLQWFISKTDREMAAKEVMAEHGKRQGDNMLWRAGKEVQ